MSRTEATKPTAASVERGLADMCIREYCLEDGTSVVTRHCSNPRLNCPPLLARSAEPQWAVFADGRRFVLLPAIRTEGGLQVHGMAVYLGVTDSPGEVQVIDLHNFFRDHPPDSETLYYYPGLPNPTTEPTNDDWHFALTSLSHSDKFVIMHPSVVQIALNCS
jgi:hypothetical protein